MKRRPHLLCAIAAASLAAPQPAAAQTAGGMPLGVLPGDGNLTCPQILAEADLRLKEHDLLLEASDNIRVSPGAETRALQALSSGLGGLFSSLPGPLAGLAGSTGYKAAAESFAADARRARGGIEARQDFVNERIDMMHGLYQRKCLGDLGSSSTPEQSDRVSMPLSPGKKVARAGDTQLSCTELTAEMAGLQAEMELNIDKAGKAMMSHARAEMDRERALSAATQAAGALGSLIPMGIASGAAKAAATAAAGAARIAHDPTGSAARAVQPMADRQAETTKRMQQAKDLYIAKCIAGSGAD